MLVIQNLSCQINQKQILNKINLKLPPGSIHIFWGPNGHGKSTLFQCLIGYYHGLAQIKIDGKIYFNEVDLTNLAVDVVSTKHKFFLAWQNPVAIPGLTYLELFKNCYQNQVDKYDPFVFFDKMNALLTKFGLNNDFLTKHVNVDVSGGQKKIAEMIQLLLLAPKVILLDEIDAGLDQTRLELIFKSLLEYYQQTNCTILIISHQTAIFKYLPKTTTVHNINNGQLETSQPILAFQNNLKI